jgi:hypothetical protein
MEFVADILLMLGALGAIGYCLVLSRRLRRFNDLETGVGGAIALLSAQVDDLTKALENARRVATASAQTLDDVTGRAEAASKRLELLMASLHDLPETRPAPAAGAPVSDDEGRLFFSQRRRATAVVR